MSCGRAAVALAAASALACATHAVRLPDTVRGYEIVVTGQDTLSRALGRELAGEGLRVRSSVRGGTRPAAVLIHFVFREHTGAPAALYGRLANTRTGRVIAAAAIPLDETPTAARDSVPALVQALLESPITPS